MGLLGFAGLVAIIVGAYWWAVLPQLRKLAWRDGFVVRLWAFAGNSKTIIVGYAAELLVLDEAQLLDWSSLVGSERAGRVMVVMGAVMILLRLVTRAAVTFTPRPPVG